LLGDNVFIVTRGQYGQIESYMRIYMNVKYKDMHIHNRNKVSKICDIIQCC